MHAYIALIRGINVSGKNRLAMPELKKALQTMGFSDVKTLLNSGNVTFCAEETDAAVLQGAIAGLLRDSFQLEVPLLVLPREVLAERLSHAPDWWGTADRGQYDNLIFLLTRDTPEDICRLVGKPTEGLERIACYRDVIFWSFDRTAYSKCRWWKQTAAPGIAERLTIRTANTVKKLL